VPSKVRIVVAFFEQLHKHVHGHERFLISSAIRADDAREELELLGLSLSAREAFWAERSSNTMTAPSGCGASPMDRVRRDLEREVAETPAAPRCGARATTRERLEEEITERRGRTRRS